MFQVEAAVEEAHRGRRVRGRRQERRERGAQRGRGRLHAGDDLVDVERGGQSARDADAGAEGAGQQAAPGQRPEHHFRGQSLTLQECHLPAPGEGDGDRGRGYVDAGNRDDQRHDEQQQGTAGGKRFIVGPLQLIPGVDGVAGAGQRRCLRNHRAQVGKRIGDLHPHEIAAAAGRQQDVGGGMRDEHPQLVQFLIAGGDDAAHLERRELRHQPRRTGAAAAVDGGDHEQPVADFSVQPARHVA